MSATIDKRTLPVPQQEGIDKIIADLKGDEVRSDYPLRMAPHWRLPYASGTVLFHDGTERVWYVRPDGSSTWAT